MLLLLLGLSFLSAIMGFIYQRNVPLVNRFSVTTSVIILVLSVLSPWLIATNYQVAFPVASISTVKLTLELQYDHLTWLMLCLISIISLMIHSYATRYLQSDHTQARFMGQISALTTAVMLLVTSGNLFTAFIAWQFIGLCLYLLLNHYHYDAKANKAAKKKFIINRVGDICFLLAVLYAYAYYGTTSFSVLLGNPNPLTTSLLSPPTLILSLIFIAVMTKSAQFPFHIWLPDTMETPTPVSALMHAGVINSGGFLLARLSPWIIHESLLMNAIFIVGLLTTLLGGFFMLTQSDIKKQLAYSTMGQMGYMVLQCGLGCFAAAVFHLIAHGFYKATLFLQSGSGLYGVNRLPHKISLENNRWLRFILTMAITLLLCFIGALLLEWFNKHNQLNKLLWLFIAITLAQFVWNIMGQTRKINALIGQISFLALIFLLYLSALNLVINLIHNIVEEINFGPSSWQLGIISLCMLLVLLFWWWPQSRLSASVNYKKLYLLSLNKINIEAFYRQRILEPLRKLGDLGYQTLTFNHNRSIRISVYALITLLGVFTALGSIRWLQARPSMELGVWLNVLIFTVVLIIANRTKTLKELWCMIALAALAFSNVALFLGNKNIGALGIYHLINNAIILCTLTLLLARYNQKSDYIPTRTNRLPWISVYITALLMLLIGIPGTSSFISEFYILQALLIAHPITAFLLSFSMILLALVILHSLQVHIFNPAHASRLDPHLPTYVHLICCLAIGFNIWNGINPTGLLHIIFSLSGVIS